MKKTILIAGLSIMISCGQQKTDVQAISKKVMQTSREWSQVASTSDVDKIVNYWTDDAIVVMPGQPPLKGKNEIRKMVEESFKMQGFHISWEPQSAEVSQSGDMVYLIEKTQVTVNDSTGKAITVHENGITVWKKQPDGSWKAAADISSNE